MQLVDQRTTQLLNDRFISWKPLSIMPRTIASAATSSVWYSPSYQYPDRYVDLSIVMKAFSRQEDVATAINLLDNEWQAFTEVLFLNHSFQSIKQLKNRLENEKRAARDWISRLLAKEKFDRLYQWIIRQSLGLNEDLPLGDDTPPPVKWLSPIVISSSSSSHIIPKQVCPQVRHYTKSENEAVNLRQEFLNKNFPEDCPPGLFGNPVLIEDDDEEPLVSVQRTEESGKGLMLRFSRSD
jgi:hypothetical protein